MGVLDGLNDAQRAAVQCIDGPLLVLAGAGTGKTKVITARIAYLLSRGVRPHHILAVTFTKKAALEMQERLGTLLGFRPKDLTVSTFHSLGFRLLREMTRRELRVFSDAEKLGLVTAIIREHRFDLDSESTLSQISRAKNWGKTPAALQGAAVNAEENEFAECYRLYDARMQEQGAIDLDDMITLPAAILDRSPERRARYQARYRYILVDEYQDTNRPQYTLMRSLLGPQENLCVVGDDDQSIYGFRGADVERILRFREDFPRASTVALQMNYRSHAEVIALANAIITASARRYPKTLESSLGPGARVEWRQANGDDSEAEAIAVQVAQIVRSGEFRYRDIAILTRARAISDRLHAEFLRREIPSSRGKAAREHVNAVSFLTLHQSKGLEFPVVFLPALEDDTLPHFHAVAAGADAVEEERRLFYVGVTRAKARLMLSASSGRGGHERSVSRFLQAVPARLWRNAA